MLKPIFFTRANVLSAFQASWLKVEAATWAALGGCDSAQLGGWNQGRLDLAGALGLLRCGVELVDEAEEPCWWGYVNAVQLYQGRQGATCSLEKMSNRIKVTYLDLDNRALMNQIQRLSTAWADNADSELAYGTKEKIITRTESTGSQAVAVRTGALNENAWPLALPAVAASTKSVDVALELKGWWHSAGWRYYEQAAGVIENVVDGVGLEDLGTGTGNQKLAQKFTVGAVGWSVGAIWLQICKIMNPGDAVKVDICADSAGLPGASLGQNVEITAANISTGYAWTGFIFATPPDLAANTDYWIVITRTGANNGTNFYRVKIDLDLKFLAGAFKIWNGGAWAAMLVDGDLVFRMSGMLETTEQIELMAAAGCGGQFLAGVRIDNASGIYTNPWRSGSQTAQAEINRQLAGGDTSGNRLLCEVTHDRFLRVYSMPAASSAAIRIGGDGGLKDLAGNPLPAWRLMAGQWAILENPWLGGGSQYQQISDRVFLNGVEYDPVSGSIKLK